MTDELQPLRLQRLIGKVIQLNPDNEWGPLLMIIDKVTPHSVRAYAFIPHARNQSPTMFYYFVEDGCYTVIGPSAARGMG